MKVFAYFACFLPFAIAADGVVNKNTVKHDATSKTAPAAPPAAQPAVQPAAKPDVKLCRQFYQNANKGWRPNCDNEGFFEPVQCRDNWCSCVTANGKRIGTFHIPQKFSQGMDCKCAVANAADEHKLMQCIYNGNEKPDCVNNVLFKTFQQKSYKCDQDGTYALVQRDLDAKKCYCHPRKTDKTKKDYSGTLVDCPFMNCECARKEIQKNTILDCNSNGNYRTVCTLLKKTQNWLSCEKDGTFTKIQCYKKRCYCPDAYTGAILGFYEFPSRRLQIKYTNERMTATSELCKCARHEAQYQALGIEMKLCLHDGSYEPCEKQRSRVLTTGFAAVKPVCNCRDLFARVQCDEHWCYCSNPYGRILSKYAAALKHKIHMLCDCARQEDDFIRNSTALVSLGCDRFGNFPVPKALE